ncbi:MAG: ATP-binding cassette domain-containing protein [Faecousia sp.]
MSWKRIKPYLGSVEEEPDSEITSRSPLSVQNVTFVYPGQDALFANVTFQAKPGEIVGLTGKIACGKSTLGKLLIGELPYQGEICLGNVRFSNQGERYENGVGYLGHQPELFSGTIEENICMGKPGDISPVLRAVCMDREVAEFPDGIHTVIGSGGVRLSGGQQARIALARTLYHRKPLMVLDDPFSAVDMETETRIFDNLRTLAKDSVVLLISHRLSLFPQLDQVLWLEDGRVTAASHGELLQKNANYRTLYEAQRKEAVSDEN